jgi:cell division protein FtsI (penicillin-binding protein 3)
MFLVFLGSLVKIIFDDNRRLPNIHGKKEYIAFRGSIYSNDSKLLSTSVKYYQASINGSWVYDDKKKLFAKLFSLYSDTDENIILKKLNLNSYTSLSKKLTSKQVQNIKMLSKKFYKMNVFKKLYIKNKYIYHTIETRQYSEKRIYPYGDVLSPILGYVVNTEVNGFIRIKGSKGIENFYDYYLDLFNNAQISGVRDIGFNIVLDGNSKMVLFRNGYDLFLNIPLSFQKKLEDILLIYKKKLGASEVIASVMKSDNGKMLGLATSNRYNPSSIRVKDYPNLNPSITEFSFEPGSVIKPLFLAKAIDEHIVKIGEKIPGHNGRFKLGRKIITDEHKNKEYSLEDIIVKSSNIAMSEISLRVDPYQALSFLNTLGFMDKSGIDLNYESISNNISLNRLKIDINKATIFYGYGIRTTFMKFMKLYSMFSNEGVVSTPKIVDYMRNQKSKIFKIKQENKRMISKESALFIKEALINTVQKGTAVAIKTPGLSIGAKTGTAHIYKNGKYVNEYISSVFGFVSDGINTYTIGVTTFNPKKHYFASQTSAKIFKSIIDTMVSSKYIIPSKTY